MVGNLLDGTVIHTSDLEYGSDGNTIQVAEHRVRCRYGDWFLYNGTRIANLRTNLRKIPLPIAAQRSETNLTTLLQLQFQLKLKRSNLLRSDHEGHGMLESLLRPMPRVFGHDWV